MRTPPPVSALLEQDRLWQWACAGLTGLAGVCLGVWLVLHGSTFLDQPLCTVSPASTARVCGLWPWALPALLGSAAAVAAWRHAAAEALVLAWTGSRWQVRSLEPGLSSEGALLDRHPLSSSGRLPAPAVSCVPALMIDLGHWMLLRLQVPGLAAGKAPRPMWRAVSATRMDPWSWHGLRIALHCARSETAVDAQGGPIVAAGARRKPADLGSER